MELNSQNIAGKGQFLPLPKSGAAKAYKPRFIKLDGSVKAGKADAAKMALSMNDDDRKLKESCNDFEAIMVNFLLREMKKTVNKGGFFGEDKFASESFDQMLDTHISKSIAGTGSFGIAQGMFEQLNSARPGFDFGLKHTK